MKVKISEKMASELLEQDHEVSMARAELRKIKNDAEKLEDYLGDEEKDIPGWIQGHITTSGVNLSHAADQYHEN